jgi:hypothetical protein
MLGVPLQRRETYLRIVAHKIKAIRTAMFLGKTCTLL